MGTNCAPLIADLFLFCYKMDFMMSLSDDKQAEIDHQACSLLQYIKVNIFRDFFVCNSLYPDQTQRCVGPDLGPNHENC